MIMSVYKPDPELRNEAQDLGCFVELMDIREEMINYLTNLRKGVNSWDSLRLQDYMVTRSF